MTLTKTKLHRMLDELINETQGRINDSVLTKADKAKARAKMLRQLSDDLTTAGHFLRDNTPRELAEA